jgi:hypothetical protein
MTQDTIQKIELNIANAKKIVDMGTALERLSNNRDFKKVIQEGYFEQEAIRLVHLKADPNFQTIERQQSIITQMDAIGSLVEFFQTIKQKASMASKAIDADEEARDEILAEEMNNV